MRQNRESIYATRGGPFEPVDGVFGSVYRKTSVYLHILDPDRFGRRPLALTGALKDAKVQQVTVLGKGGDRMETTRADPLDLPRAKPM